MEKTNQRVRLTKKLLKDSLIDLLQEKDIRKIAIRELCENAGINHCTFYKYYGSQYDLLAEMESDLLEKVEMTLAEKSQSEPDKQPIITLLMYLEENLKITRLLINNNIDPLFPEKLFSLPTIQKELANELSENYHEGTHEYAMNFVFYGAFRVAQMWINKDNRESVNEIADLLMAIFEKNGAM